jgi:FKBP-type peptidyl-prolyl cis-trans isomerase FkpA
MTRKKSGFVFSLAAVLLTLSLISCDPTKKYQKQEDEEIQSYLTENSTLDFVKQASGLYYLEVVAGTGISPVRTDSVYINYTGKYLDGTIFDTNSTTGKPFGSIVGKSIVGFDEGLTKMKVGGKSTFLIPSKLGYGSMGTYGISGYTPLLFDVELLKVVPYTGQ